MKNDLNCRAWKFIRDVNASFRVDMKRTALKDGTNEVSYGDMYRIFKRYAAVFSALGMTGQNHARVGVLGSTAKETICAVYGLNMVGAEVSLSAAYNGLDPRKIIRTVKDEHLSDFIITDDFAQVNLVYELLKKREELKLRHVILMHIPFSGSAFDPMARLVRENGYMQLKSILAPMCMDTLLDLYGERDVIPETEGSECAFILHTSGTTGGSGKPVVLSDRSLNAACACFFGLQGYEELMKAPVSGLTVDMSNAYSLVDQVHLPLALGGTIVCVPGGILNPLFCGAIPEHKITCLFGVSAMLDLWMKLPEWAGPDLSSLKAVILGGSAVTVKDKVRYRKYLAKHGAADCALISGYGISELGGACFLSSRDEADESLGNALPGIRLLLYDEDRDIFLSEKDAPCEGILYLSSPFMAEESLDGKQVLAYETVGGLPYICTNDLLRIDEKGRFIYLGRANRYFINEKGIKYEAGRVETAFAEQTGIESCGIVPVYVKTKHDNIPMLCVRVLGGAETDIDTVRRALKEVFILQKKLGPENLPHRVMITDEMPRNANGKIDLYRINNGEVSGKIYEVKPVKRRGALTDLKLAPLKGDEAEDMIKEVMSGIAEDIRENFPVGIHSKQKEGGKTMNNDCSPFANFAAMNQFAGDMMKMMAEMFKNMQGNTGSNGFNMNMCGAPWMQGMPFMPGTGDMQKTMPFMQGMPWMQGMPDMQKAMQNMKEMGPAMQAMNQQMMNQMNQMMTFMNQMNQMTWQMMREMQSQNMQMWMQFFRLLMNMTPSAVQGAGTEEQKTESPDHT